MWGEEEAAAPATAGAASFEAVFEAFDVSDDPPGATTPAAGAFDADFGGSFEANFDDSPLAATPAEAATPAAAIPTEPAVNADEEAARRDFELQRQRRLEALEKAKQSTPPQKASSSWGGWLSSNLSAMPSSSELLTQASEKAASAAAALQSPAALQASLAQAAEAVGAAAIEKEKELREAVKTGAEKLQQSVETVSKPGLLSPVASLSSTLDTVTKALQPAPFDWSRLSSSAGGDGADDGDAGEGGGGDDTGSGVVPDGAVAGAPSAAEPPVAVAPKKKKKRDLTSLPEDEQFEALVEDGLYEKAAWLAANSPKQMMRSTPEAALATIRRFEAAGAGAGGGGQPPILIYFGALLKRSTSRSEPLTLVEGLELARPVVAQGQLPLLHGWISAGRLEPSEELGDILREKDLNGAIKMYKRLSGDAADSPTLAHRVLRAYAELGDIEEVCYLARERRPPAPPDWLALLVEIAALPGGVPRAIAFEATLRAMPPPPPPPPEDDELAMMQYKSNPPPPPAPTHQQCVGAFLECGCLAHATKLCLDALGADTTSIDAQMQTKILDSNLREKRSVGDALLEAASLPLADAATIATTCEGLRMLLHALRLHPAAQDVHRLLCHDGVDEESASMRVGQMPPSGALDAVTALLAHGTPRALAKALLVARTHAEAIGHEQLHAAFAKHGTDAGLVRYLGARLATPAGTSDPALTLAYLTATRKAGRHDEVERVTRDPAATYDAQQVLKLLTSAPPPPPSDDKSAAVVPAPTIDPRPIINVCDRFDLVEQMAGFFYAQRKLNHLALYVNKIHTARAPQALAGLLDAGCEPPRAVELVASLDKAELQRVGDPTLPARLVAVCEQRQQLAVLTGWLKAREAEGLDEGSAEATAILGALKKIEPLKRMFG